MDLGILVPIIGVTIPVVALMRKPFESWMAFKERALETRTTEAAEKAAQYAARSERLEQRVAVLERILTDRSTHLGDEIERLRDRPVN